MKTFQDFLTEKNWWKATKAHFRQDYRHTTAGLPKSKRPLAYAASKALLGGAAGSVIGAGYYKNPKLGGLMAAMATTGFAANHLKHIKQLRDKFDSMDDRQLKRDMMQRTQSK